MFFQKQLLVAGLLSAMTLTTLNAQISVTIQVNHQVSCNGYTDGSLTAIVSPVGVAYSFSWSNGGNTATINDLAAGAYVVTVQNAAGASAIVTGLLTEPEVLVVTPITPLPLYVNPTGTVEVETTGGTEPFSFQWFDESNILYSTDEDLMDAPAGIYALLATDANGCNAELSPVDLILTTGTSELRNIGIRTYPNPAVHDLILEIPDAESQTVQVFTASGQQMLLTQVQGPRTSIPVENWPAGYYTLVFPEAGQTVKVLVGR